LKFVIFDDAFRSNFFPITLTRSTGDLRIGILKLRQRILNYFSVLETNIIISSTLEEIYKERHINWNVNTLTNEETIFINSRIKINETFKNAIMTLKTNECLVNEDTILAAKCIPASKNNSSENINELFGNLKIINEPKLECWEFLWDLLKANSEYITRDFNDVFYDKDNYFETELGTTVINPYNVWIGDGVTLKHGVIIDATDGPVILDENSTIMSNTVVIGPVYIGKGSTIKIGAKIYKGTSIGPVCKVGGEVEETIFQGYSNKQYDGYLGHSYLGEWVDLGANTNNCALNNNYKTASVYFYPQADFIDTQNKFIGTFIGDHSKTGVNSTINAGTVIGIGCDLDGSELINKNIPSFKYVTGLKAGDYLLDKFIEIAELVKKRGDLTFSGSEKELYSMIHKQVFDN